jgi:Spy/CpxP family protein refolding chaperone
MKHIILKIQLVCAVLFFSFNATAQNGRAMERVHTLKIAFISDRLQLTSGQAEHFWPIYNDYEADLKDLRMRFRQDYNLGDRNLSDEEARRQLEDNLDMQEAVIDLRKKYKNEFLKVITPSQLVDLYNAEKDFRIMLMKELQNRRERNNAAPMRWGGRRMYRY